MMILHQNVKTGAAHDITTLTESAKWKTKRSGAPASMELTVLTDPQIQWDEGDIISVTTATGNLFYGFAVKLSETDKKRITVTAYDQVWYLKKNKETYVFVNKRADQILTQIAEDFGLQMGALENTSYMIPSMIEDNQTLLDIVLKALDYTLINTAKMFYLWDDFGKLTLSDVEKSRLEVVIGDNSLATGYTYEREIDSETSNKIKLAKDNKETGKRDIYIFQDGETMKQWGTLQYYEKVDAEMTEGQIKERGEKLLAWYNLSRKSFSLSALADTRVRAGTAVYVTVADVKMQSWFIVEEATHDLVKETMDLKLKVV